MHQYNAPWEVYRDFGETPSSQLSDKRRPTQASNTYSDDCILCDKKMKYFFAGYNKDELVQACGLCADKTLHQLGTSKYDETLLRVTAYDIAPKKVKLVLECLTRPLNVTQAIGISEDLSDKIYENVSAKAQKVLDYIQSEEGGSYYPCNVWLNEDLLYQKERLWSSNT